MSNEYQVRVHRVMDYIDEHLGETLELEKLSSVANFSPFHFHRIFSTLIGETLYQYILRLKLERAATKLLMYPDSSVTEVAFDLGFSSSATFARAFKERFKMSASDWRRDIDPENEIVADFEYSKKRKGLRKMRQVPSTYERYVDPVNGNLTWRMTMEDSKFKDVKVEIVEMEEKNVAYVRYMGPYKGDEALFERLFGKLAQWAGPRGLIIPNETQFMTLYHDDPSLTEDAKLRISICMTVPEGTEVGGEISMMKVKGGKYAVGEFEINPDEYGNGWGAMYGGWLPESGFQPTDSPPFELYLNDPKEHPEGKHHFAIYIPVKPL